jgi:hypothetical protein
MSITDWNKIKIQDTWFTYEYRDSWGKRYYSFDNGQTWATSKKKAFESTATQSAFKLLHPNFKAQD